MKKNQPWFYHSFFWLDKKRNNGSMFLLNLLAFDLSRTRGWQPLIAKSLGWQPLPPKSRNWQPLIVKL